MSTLQLNKKRRSDAESQNADMPAGFIQSRKHINMMKTGMPISDKQRFVSREPSMQAMSEMGQAYTIDMDEMAQSQKALPHYKLHDYQQSDNNSNYLLRIADQ